MSESQPSPIPNDVVNAPTEQPGFRQMVNSVVVESGVGLPSLDTFHAAQYLAEDMSQDHKGRFHGPDGRLIPADEAKIVATVADPKTWVLDVSSEAKMHQAIDAETVTDLPSGVFKDAEIQAATRSFKTSHLEARANLEALKQQARDALDLSTAIKTELMNEELTYVSFAAEQATMIAAQPKIEQEVAERMSRLQAKGEGARGMAQANIREEITKRYQADAKAAGATAAGDRRTYIEANGGITELEAINKAAELEAWKQRMGVGGRGAVKHEAEKPEFTKLERPEHISMKDWLGLSVNERKRALANSAAVTDRNNTQATAGQTRNLDQNDEVTGEMIDEAAKENWLLSSRQLSQAENNYVQISAEMRQGHLGRIEGKGLRRWLATFASGISDKKSVEMDARVAEARKQYSEKLRSLQGAEAFNLEAEGNTSEEARIKLIDVTADKLIDLETAIFNRRTEMAEDQKMQALNRWLGKVWATRGRVAKGAVVAAPALVMGVAAGVVAGAVLTAPVAVIAAGAGVAYAGKKLGHAIDARANRSRVLNSKAYLASIDHTDTSSRNYRSRAMANEVLADATEEVEERTTAEVRQSQKNRKIAGSVGAIAAGIGFGAGLRIGRTVSAATNSDVPASEGQSNQSNPWRGGNGVSTPDSADTISAPDRLVIDPNASVSGAEIPSVDPNQLPYDFLRSVVPGNEMSTLSSALDPINAAHSTNFQLISVGDTVQLYNGTHALNPAQQAEFNRWIFEWLQTQG